MLYDDVLEWVEEERPRRKPRGNERTRARRVEDYLYEEFEDYHPRRHKNHDAEGEDYSDHYRRNRKRDPYWKRRREELM